MTEGALRSAMDQMLIWRVDLSGGSERVQGEVGGQRESEGGERRGRRDVKMKGACRRPRGRKKTGTGGRREPIRRGGGVRTGPARGSKEGPTRKKVCEARRGRLQGAAMARRGHDHRGQWRQWGQWAEGSRDNVAWPRKGTHGNLLHLHGHRLGRKAQGD